MRFDGILFDLDGTLWDSCLSVAESWRSTLRTRYNAQHLPSIEDIQSIMGLPASEIARRLFTGYDAPAQEVCGACMADECGYLAQHGGALYPGVPQMLAALAAQAPLFIVSNCQDGYIQSFLTWSGLGRLFQDFECEGRTGLSKAENIRLVVQRNGLHSPVYIGDTALDEASACAAGCPFVHAAYGFGNAVAPLTVIHTPGGLPAALDAL